MIDEYKPNCRELGKVRRGYETRKVDNERKNGRGTKESEVRDFLALLGKG